MRINNIKVYVILKYKQTMNPVMIFHIVKWKKMERYVDLKELKQLGNTKTKVVPIIIGRLGPFLKTIAKNIERILMVVKYENTCYLNLNNAGLSSLSLLFTPLEFLTSVLADGFSQEFE